MSAPAIRTPGKREERTATSRARILDAAVACLVEDGYAGATTLRIQARAGVSRGRLLHHFPSRDELLVAASRHLATERLRGTDPELDGLDVPLPERIDLAVERLWATFSEPLFWAGDGAVDGGPHQPRAAGRPCCRRNARSGRRYGRVGARSFYGPRLVGHPQLPAGARPDLHEHGGASG